MTFEDEDDRPLGASDQAERIAEEDAVPVPVLPLTAAGYAPIAGGASAGVVGPAQASAVPLLGGAFPAFAPVAAEDSGAGTTRGDHRLIQRVEDALAEDGRLSPGAVTALRINATDGGVVTLGGNVPSDAERELAAAIAGGVGGVRQVVWENTKAA
jgi:hypothetical protein